MELDDLKCAVVLDAELPIGVAANIAAIMGVSLGKRFPGIVGADVYDAEGSRHAGIVEVPIPVLKATERDLRDFRARALSIDEDEVAVVDFTNVAQGCKEYDEYITKMGGTKNAEIAYLGLLLVGKKKAVNKLIGSLPLLR